MRLALDNHYSPLIATLLRERGHDAVAAGERGWGLESDESVLAICARELRALLTNHVGDFTNIARSWAAAGRSHAGLIFTSDGNMPRTRNLIGRYVDVLAALLAENRSDDAFTNRIHWL